MRREKTKHRGIYKVGDEYYVTYYDGSTKLSSNGVPYLRKVEKRVGKRLGDALKFKIEMEGKIKRGIYGVIERQEKLTFDDLLRLYEEEGEAKGYVVRVKDTFLGYFGDWKLSHITRQDLFSFRDKVKATPKQRGQNEVTDAHVNRIMAGLRRLFNFAVNRELMADTPFPKNPKSGLFYPEQKGLRNFFTEEQMLNIIEASPGWLRPMVITAYLTGMREGELLGLRWEWVDLHMGIIYLPSSKTLKDLTGKGQRIVMQRELIDIFQSLPKRSEWVFSKPDGTTYRHWDTFKAFRKVLQSLGIDTRQYSWKEIRHTTASIMNLKGSPPMAIRDQLRHRSVNTTESFYIGSDVEYQRQQIEKLVLKKPEEGPPLARA